MFGRDFTVRTITMETVRLVRSRKIQSRAKHKEEKKKWTFSSKSLSLKRSVTAWKTMKNMNICQVSFIIQKSPYTKTAMKGVSLRPRKRYHIINYLLT